MSDNHLAIARFGRLMRWALWGIVLFTLLCLFVPAYLWDVQILPMRDNSLLLSLSLLEELAMSEEAAPMGEVLVMSGLLISSIAVAVALVWQSDRLCWRYSQGDVFSLACARHFKTLGLLLIALFVINALADYALARVFVDASGEIELLLQSSDTLPEWERLEWEDELLPMILIDLPLLFFGLFISGVAQVMRLGASLQADVDATI